MEENVRKAVIDSLDPKEAVSLVKQLVDIPSPEGEELECARFLYNYMRIITCAEPALKHSFKKWKKDEPMS